MHSSPPSSDSLERKLQRLAPLASSSRAFLLVLDGPRAGRLHLLSDKDTVIGRSTSADITVTDAAASHDHARVVLRGNAYHIEDLESRNGTRVNGEPVTQRRLRKRDRIQVGSTTLVFLEETVAESTLTVTLGNEQEPLELTTRGSNAAARSTYPVVDAAGEPLVESPIVSTIRKAIEVWRFVKRNIWALILLPPLGLAAGIWSLKLQPAPEVTQAAVRLTHAQQLNPVDEGFGTRQRTSAVPFFDAPEANFINPELAKRALAELDVEASPELVETVFSGLKMERTTRATDGRGGPAPDGVFVATFTQPAKPPPVLDGPKFLDEYLDRYLQHEVEKSIRNIRSQAGFLEGELEKVEKELHSVEEELTRFRGQNIDALPEQAGAVMGSKLTLLERRGELEIEAERLRAQVANVRNELRQTDTVVTRRVEDLKPLQTDLETKKRQMSDLRAKGFRPDHPEMRQLNTQIESIEREIQLKMNSRVTELERTTDPRQQELSRLLQQYTGDLRVAEAALGRLGEQLGAAAGKAAMVPEVDTTIQRLERRRDSLQRMRAQLFEQHRKTLLQIDLESANVRSRYEVIEPAELKPSKDKKFLLQRLGGGLAVGLVLAFAVAGVMEIRRVVRKNPGLLRITS